MAPAGLPAFLKERMVASFQIPGTPPLEKLSLKVDNSSVLAIGLSALREIGGIYCGPVSSVRRKVCMAVPSSQMVKSEQQDSVAVDSCSAFFRWLA